MNTELTNISEFIQDKSKENLIVYEVNNLVVFLQPLVNFFYS